MADDDEFKEESAPPPKRARRAVTKRKPITVAPDSDDDDDDDYEPVEPLTKLEDESGNSDNDNDNDNEDDSFAAPSTSADDQPGPSGLGKDGVEAPKLDIKFEAFIKLEGEERENKENAFACTICKRRYKTKEYLKAHLELHNSGKGFTCTVCPKVFQTAKGLLDHSIFHSERKHKCNLCDYASHRNNDLKRHVRLVHQSGQERRMRSINRNVDKKSKDLLRKIVNEEVFSCTICKRRYKSKDYLKAHIELHTSGKGFTCPVCPKVFETSKGLADHSVFHAERKHKCSLCDYACHTNSMLKRHMMLRHQMPYERRVPDITSTTCKICNKKLASIMCVRSHMKLHKPRRYKCDHCDKAFCSKSVLDNHMKIHTEVGEFCCEQCPKTFSLKMYLIRHQKSVHENNVKILCEICSASFNSKSGYVIHMRRHTKEYVAKCEECGLGFITNSDYEKHRIIKHGLMKYVCHICGKNLSSIGRLRRHVDRHATQEEKEKAGIKCSLCGKMFVHQKLLDIHHYVAHTDKNKRLFTCHICCQQFTKASMKNHFKVHEKRNNEIFACSFCEEIFTYEQTLKRHLAEEHPETVPFKCDKCGKGCISLSALKVHIAVKHKFEGDRDEDDPLACIVCTEKFATTDLLLQHQVQKHSVNVRVRVPTLEKKCTICHKIFSNLDYLAKHYLDHENAKEHFCDLCQHKFESLNDLKLHFQDHTREKEFYCFYCSKCFSKNNFLMMHERIHTGEKPFVCPHCGKGFNQAASLRVHVRGHTGEQPYVCEFCGKGHTSKGTLNAHLKSCTKKRSN